MRLNSIHSHKTRNSHPIHTQYNRLSCAKSSYETVGTSFFDKLLHNIWPRMLKVKMLTIYEGAVELVV